MCGLKLEPAGFIAFVGMCRLVGLCGVSSCWSGLWSCALQRHCQLHRASEQVHSSAVRWRSRSHLQWTQCKSLWPNLDAESSMCSRATSFSMQHASLQEVWCMWLSKPLSHTAGSCLCPSLSPTSLNSSICPVACFQVHQTLLWHAAV